MIDISIPQIARSCNVNTNKTNRNRSGQSITQLEEDARAEDLDWFDEDVYSELSIEDDRNAEVIGHKLGRSKNTIARSFRRLEAKRLIHLIPKPNGKRINPRYRKIKLTSNDRIKVIDLFNAPYYENWNRATRIQLIKRYMRIGWNIVPLTLDMQPIMEEAEWDNVLPKEKLNIFSDQVFGVGLFINQHLVFKFATQNDPNLKTLTAKSPDGYHCFFWRTAETHYIFNLDRVVHGVDVKTKGSFVVLPPTPGYEWIKLVQPSHLSSHPFYYPELLEMFDHAMVRKSAATSRGQSYTQYVLPDVVVYPYRDEHLFRRGRSLRACGATFEQIEDDLQRVNQEVCRPPIDDGQLARIARRVWELENKKDFVAFAERRKKS